MTKAELIVRSLFDLLEGCEIFSDDGTVFIKCNGHNWTGEDEVTEGEHAEELEKLILEIQNPKEDGKQL